MTSRCGSPLLLLTCALLMTSSHSEGLVAGLLFTAGSMGFITLKGANDLSVPSSPKQRGSLVLVGLGILWLAYLGTRGFMYLKIPTYLA